MTLPDPETCRRLARDVAPRWVWLRGMSVITTHTAGLPWVEAGTSLVIDSEADLDEMVLEQHFGPIPPDVSHHHPDVERLWAERDEAMERARANALPDLCDPLTAAGALPVCRMAWNDPTIYAMQALRDRADSWVVRNSTGTPYQTLRRCLRDDPYYPTELEALIAAILAAPEKP